MSPSDENWALFEWVILQLARPDRLGVTRAVAHGCCRALAPSRSLLAPSWSVVLAFCRVSAGYASHLIEWRLFVTFQALAQHGIWFARSERERFRL